MQINIKFRSCVLFATTLIFTTVILADGNICTWTGAAGDGKWSTAGNWDTPPALANDDILVFEGGSVTSYNDMEGIAVAGMRCTGTGTKTFDGETIIFTGMPFLGLSNQDKTNRTYTVSNSCDTVYNCNLDFSANGRIFTDVGASSATFNGNIFVRAGKKLNIGDPYAKNRDVNFTRPYYFNGRIDAPEATIIWAPWSKSITYINGTVDVLNFNFDYPASAIYLPAFSGGVTVRSGTFAPWYVPIHFRCGEVFGENLPILDFGTAYWSSGANGTVYLDGNTVVIDRLGAGSKASSYPSDTTGNSYYSSAAATLLMKATGDTSTYSVLRGAVSMVWDPDDSTRVIEFKLRKSTTTGSVKVNAGTFRISGAATFPNLQTIDLASGAVCEMCSTTTSVRPLNSLSTLKLGESARFVVASGTTSPCFADGGVIIKARSSSRLALPSGFTQTVSLCLVDGVPLSPGTYTGEGGTSGTVTNLIEGTGLLVVPSDGTATAWSGSVGDDEWSSSGNWSGGVPVSGMTGYVYRHGETSINAPSEMSADQLIMDVAEGQTTLNVDSALTISGTIFDIGTNSVFSANSSADIAYSSPTDVDADTDVIHVHDGGKMILSGRLVTSNLYGRITVEDGGSLCIDGAQIDAAPPAVKANSAILNVAGGTLAISNSSLTLGYNFNDDVNKGDVCTLFAGEGSSTTIHNTYLRLDEWIWGVIFGTGTTILSGDTHLNFHKHIRASFSAEAEGEECRVYLRGSARISGAQELAIGNNVASSRSILTIDSPDAKVYSCSGCQVGCTHGYGEINILAGLFQGGGHYGLHIGYKRPESSTAATSGCFPTGVVKVAGGALTPLGLVSDKRPNGLIVGNGIAVPGATGVSSRFTGILELSDGVVTNHTSYAIFGLAHGYGVMSQTGGRFLSSVTAPAMIGMAGGEGEWNQSGGVSTFARNVYVGGLSTNALGVGSWNHECFLSRHDAKGTLNVSGGSFTVNNGYDIVLSEDGEGTIALSGEGVVSAHDLILSNTVDTVNSVTRTSTMKFTEDDDGNAGSIALSGKLVIGDGASFICDFATYQGKKSRFKLVTADSIAGSFDSDNITFLGSYRKFADIRQTADSIEVVVNRGFMLSIK